MADQSENLRNNKTHLPRVVSLNLCADAYLMAFAKPEQILGLTQQSSDPTLSAFVEEASNFPVSGGRMSNIIEQHPDIIIINNYSPPPNKALMDRLGIKIVKLDAANSYQSARTEILQLGKAIHRLEAAKAYLAQLDKELEDARHTKLTYMPSIINYQRRGIVVGETHILDDIIQLAGAQNLGRDTGRTIGPMSLENLIRLQPDYVLSISENDEQTLKAHDRGSEILSHPALQKIFSAERHIYIPQNLTVCAGATTPKAVAHLIEILQSSQLSAETRQISE
ncbi:MAG: ABC transporter substrate-binding protein [Pseudomonadota bacterium]|nr:ABC transporter substrate-binding protein [Pseudomonadota bacterium]